MSVHGAGLGPVERITRIDGANVHYWVYREGPAAPPRHAGEPVPTVVMVHGLRGTHHGLELIAERLAGAQVVVPDLPGFGDSSPMADRQHDVAGYADVVVALADRVGSGHPVVVLGHSFGSVVAAHAAATEPALVRRLVLVNPLSTPALHGAGVMWSGIASTYYRLGGVLPERIGNALLSSKWVVLAASAAMTRTKDKQLRRFVHNSHLRNFSRFSSAALLTETFEASVMHTVAEYVDALTMPTLLIVGESDEIAPLTGQRELASRLANAELVVIPDVGHLVHYEAPATAAREMQRFFQTHES